jgi:hypothetical protein
MRLWQKLRAKGIILRESHDAPPEATGHLLRLGGLNRFGSPNYRLVWSENRLAWVAGLFEDRNDSGYLIREVLAARMLPKYPNRNRWIIEQWIAPEKYGSRETWWAVTREWGEEGNLPQLGPYPDRGDYEMACLMETPDTKEFVQITTTLIDEFFWAMKVARMRTYAERVRKRKEAAAKEKQDFKKYAHASLNEATMPVANDGMMVTVL